MKSWTTRLTIALSLLAAATLTIAEVLPDPPSRNRQVAFYVSHFLATQHLSKRPVDDEMSQRMLKAYLQQLDPLKSYFLQSDVDKFEQRKTDLDDMLRARDTRFAGEVFRVFLERLDTRMKWVEEFVNGELDFTVDEQFVIEPDDMTYSVDDQQAREFWRKRIKYDLLVLKSNDKEDKEAHETVLERYRTFARRMHQIDDDDLLERYMNALTSSYDPHTSYFSPSSFEDFRIRLGLNYEGIGAELDQKDGMPIIRRVIPGGAAAKKGELKANDRIVSVGQGEEGELVDVMNMKLDDIIDLIRGKDGTVVRLGVIPEGATDMRIYSITRARIELKDSEAKSAVFEEGTKADGSPLKVGVINLPSFYLDMDSARNGQENFKSSTRDVRRFIEQFKQQSVDALVLDLRANGGGSLTEAIGVTGLFIDQGPVVQVKDSVGNVEVQSDTEPGAAWDGPLVVLTSRFSASASEILAGAIQDYDRGLVVGDESTHGKGTVQSLVEVGPSVLKFDGGLNLGAIKITMQQFYRPNGDSTQNRGVLADVVPPSLSSHISKGESELDYAMAFDQVKAAQFQQLGQVSDDLIQGLRAKSAERLAKSNDFTSLQEKIRRYDEDAARKTISLNEQQFLELRRQADAEETQREEFETIEQGETDISRDFYLNEVLAITADYVGGLSSKKVAAR